MLLPLILASLVAAASSASKVTCGKRQWRPSVQDLIVGGTGSNILLYPWTASIVKPGFFGDTFKCGAVLLSPHYALTSAACAAPYVASPDSVRLKAGVSAWPQRNWQGEVSTSLFSVQLHPLWSAKAPHRHNLAVVRISYGIPWKRNLQPVCIPCQPLTSALSEGSPVTLTGFGKTSAKALRVSDVFQSVDVPVASTKQCEVAYGSAFDPATMFCAGVEGKDACFGDGGSPALVKGSDGLYRAIGLISWGQGCGTAGKPGVLERLDAPLNKAFIAKATKGAAQCV